MNRFFFNCCKKNWFCVHIKSCLFTLFLGVVVPHVDAKDFADASGNLGFIINMKKLQPILVDDDKTEENSKNESQPSSKRIRLDNI